MKPPTEQVQSFWKGLDQRRRIYLIGSVILTLLALLLLRAWAFRPQYETVVTSRDPAEIRAVLDGLDEEKIPYRISPDGTRVEVESSVVGRARIRAAASGASPGLEGLDSLKLGVSPRRELWSYQRALQGELVRTLNQLDEVEASRVHLVLPERSAFLGDESPGSASITLRLAPGKNLSESQIRGITALVAGAVEGLKPSRVVLVDEKGRLLSGPVEDDNQKAEIGKLVELRMTYENAYKRTIMEALTPVLGSDKHVRASVVVELDPTTVDSTVSSLDPDSQVLISEQNQEEQVVESKPQGIPGTTSNLPEYTTATTNTSQGTQSSTRSVANYEYTRTQKRVVQSAGSIKRIAATVVVNSTRLDEVISKGGTTISADEINARIADTVKTAIAFDSVRGDSVTVSYLPFSTDPTDVEAGLIEEEGGWLRYLPYAAGLLALLGLFFFVVRPILKVLTQDRGLPADAGRRVDVLVTDESPAGVPVITSAEERSDLTRRLRTLVEDFKPVEAAELNRLVDAESDVSAQVIRRWLKSS